MIVTGEDRAVNLFRCLRCTLQSDTTTVSETEKRTSDRRRLMGILSHVLWRINVLSKIKKYLPSFQVLVQIFCYMMRKQKRNIHQSDKLLVNDVDAWRRSARKRGIQNF